MPNTEQITAGSTLAALLKAKSDGKDTTELEKQFKEQSIEQLGGEDYVKEFEFPVKPKVIVDTSPSLHLSGLFHEIFN